MYKLQKPQFHPQDDTDNLTAIRLSCHALFYYKEQYFNEYLILVFEIYHSQLIINSVNYLFLKAEASV